MGWLSGLGLLCPDGQGAVCGRVRAMESLQAQVAVLRARAGVGRLPLGLASGLVVGWAVYMIQYSSHSTVPSALRLKSAQGMLRSLKCKLTDGSRTRQPALARKKLPSLRQGPSLKELSE